VAYISAIHAAAGDVEARATAVTNRPPEKLIKIGVKVVSHGRYVTFLVAEIGVPRQMFREILSLIARIRAAPAPASTADGSDMILRLRDHDGRGAP
jgi:hypothetical protein